MIEKIQQHIQQRCDEYVNEGTDNEHVDAKRNLMGTRDAKIINVRAKGKVLKKEQHLDETKVTYSVHWKFFIKHKNFYYMEEEIEKRLATFYKDEMTTDGLIVEQEIAEDLFEFTFDTDERIPFQYNRLQAVKYAERWWSEYNPAYKKFENDCTNFISQCLRAGGGPMRGRPNRTKGWWYQENNWSYSWTTAHALHLYLQNSSQGLKARRVSSVEELMLGDIICYDFEGDGRFNHNTIITGKDANGMPLVNAHTTDSRLRYWSYEDSTAYTPNIIYRFYTIVDDV